MTGINQPPVMPVPAFDPVKWMDRYIALGGGYSVVGDAIWLHWLLRSDVDEVAIKAHERVLRGHPDRREAVKALIMAKATREMADG